MSLLRPGSDGYRENTQDCGISPELPVDARHVNFRQAIAEDRFARIRPYRASSDVLVRQAEPPNRFGLDAGELGSVDGPPEDHFLLAEEGGAVQRPIGDPHVQEAE